MDEKDPGADTAMFRAYVTEGDSATPAATPNRSLLIVAGVAIAIALIVVALLVV
jgi:hypothetical protein